MKGFGQLFKAFASAMIGVGKKEDLVKNFERVDKQGPWPYIFVGLIMTIGFIGLVILTVKFTLS